MKRSSLSTLVVPALVMAWLVLTVGIAGLVSQYDFVHVFIIPFEIPRLSSYLHLSPVQYLLDLLLALVGAIVYTTACLGVGLAIMGRPLRPGVGRLATALTAFLLGEIVFSVVLLTCIALYRLTPLMVGAAFALALLSGSRRLITFVRGLPRRRLPAEFGAREKAMLLLATSGLGLAALHTSSVLGYDSVVQYFSQPKLLAMAQTPALTYPRDAYLVSSLHTEILTTALIQTFGDQSARMLSWLNGLVLVLLGLVVGEETGLGRRARLWFVCLMATSTVFVDLLGDGKIEIVSTAFVLAAIYWLMRSLSTRLRFDFLMLGIFAGFAVLARPYNILLAPLFLGLYLAAHLIREKRGGGLDLRPYLINSLWAIVPVLLLAGFHLVQNWLWRGNPLAPLVDGKTWNADFWPWQFDPRLLGLYRALYPFVATFANSPQSLGNVTPFVIGCLPLLLFKDVRIGIKEHPRLLWLAASAFVTLVIWLFAYFTVVEIRYVLFLWMVFFLFTARIMEVASARVRSAALLAPLAAVLLAFMAARTALIALGSYSPVDRTGQAHCYYLDLCSFMEPVNGAAAPGERVFVMNAYRYYLRPDLFACASRADEYDKLQSLAQARSGEFWVELYQAGFRYVTYESNFAIFHSRFGTLPPFNNVPAWLRVDVLTANTNGRYGDQLAYKLTAVQPPVPPRTYCQQDSSGIWQVRQTKGSTAEQAPP